MNLRTLSCLGAAALLGLCCLPARAIETGQPAPPFVLAGEKGEVRLADFKGQLLLIDIWASWCAPCRRSFPWLNEMQARYGGRGLRVLGINIDRQRSAADTFLREQPAHFALAFGGEGDVAMQYGLQGMPTSLLVGADGRVLLQHAGFSDADRPSLEAAIVAALPKPH